MKKPRTTNNVVPHFDARERELLAKLFSRLGSDNVHEAENARSLIDDKLLKFTKTWSDLVPLLSGGTVTVDPDLAGDIVDLGSSDPAVRAGARERIAERLARHRKNWNDFADALYGATPAPWLDPSVAPDPEPINSLALIVHLLKEYTELREHEYTAVALWTLHTHVYQQFTVTPRLALRSATGDCGKTTLLDVIGRLAARPSKFDSITASAIFHLIDESHPTLLLDEVDNLMLGLQANGRIRAIINSGHRRGGVVAIREQGETRLFSTFTPLALALPDIVGGLPRTLNSRCLTLMMRRSDGRRPLRRLDLGDLALNATYQRILLWQRDVVLDPDPTMPEGLHNRIADNWRPLLSIADSLDWGEQARKAMAIFATEYSDADAKVQLLVDIRRVFDTQEVDRLPSKTLLDALHGLVDSDWTEFRGTRGDQQPHKLKAGELAGMLRDFQIRPRSIWPPHRTADSRSAKGYVRGQFEEVWRAYCTEAGTTAQSNSNKGLRLATGGTGAGT
jgi:hypothetical protein